MIKEAEVGLFLKIIYIGKGPSPINNSNQMTSPDTSMMLHKIRVKILAHLKVFAAVAISQ